MTEEQWLNMVEPLPMLRFLLSLSGQATDRKFRFYVAGCCRASWQLISDEHARRAVEVVERFADGEATTAELAAARSAALAGVTANPEAAAAGQAVFSVAAHGNAITTAYAFAHDCKVNQRVQVALLRDLFGPGPFRTPPAIASAWLAWNGGTIPRLAEAAYQERQLPEGTLDPARLGVLADALEDAGAGGELVAHLRGPGPHWRGCWAIDVLTGRQ
jgi:hypothetical protein